MTRRSKIPWFLLSASVATAALLGYALFPQPVPVESSRVECGSVQVTVDDDGETRVRERYTVLSPLTGKLLRIALHPGDAILRGDSLLAEIESADPSLLDARTLKQSEARVRAAEAAVERAREGREIAEETIELTRKEFQRAQELIDSRSISQAEFDLLQHRFRTSQGEVRVANFLFAIAEHELELARAALITTQEGSYGSMRITSPIDGVVLRVWREDAGFVAPGTPLLEIGDPRDMEIQVDVLSQFATRIEPGDPVWIEHWGGKETLRGTVRLVEPSAFLKISALGVEEKRVNIIADFDTPWEERSSLGDGFRIEARIVVDQSPDDGLKIPLGALIRSQDDWSVFRVVHGKAELVTVKIGRTNDREAEVLEGLSESDVVILYPTERIQHGVRISKP